MTPRPNIHMSTDDLCVHQLLRRQELLKRGIERELRTQDDNFIEMAAWMTFLCLILTAILLAIFLPGPIKGGDHATSQRDQLVPGQSADRQGAPTDR